MLRLDTLDSSLTFSNSMLDIFTFRFSHFFLHFPLSSLASLIASSFSLPSFSLTFFIFALSFLSFSILFSAAVIFSFSAL